MFLPVVCLLILRTYLLTASYSGLILRISKKLGKYSVFYRLRELRKDIYIAMCENIYTLRTNNMIIFRDDIHNYSVEGLPFFIGIAVYCYEVRAKISLLCTVNYRRAT